jgi:hypothetical protein
MMWSVTYATDIYTPRWKERDARCVNGDLDVG